MRYKYHRQSGIPEQVPLTLTAHTATGRSKNQCLNFEALSYYIQINYQLKQYI